MAVIYIDANMPEACTKLMEERKEEWIEKWTERCAFYNICKYKDTIRNDYKPVDCPLKSMDDMAAAMLTDLRLEIEQNCICTYDVTKLIQQKINELREGEL